MKRNSKGIASVLLAIVLCLGMLPTIAAAEAGGEEITWDLMNHSMAGTWNSEGWALTRASNIGRATQMDGYVNVYKNTWAASGNYTWLTNTSVAVPAAGFTLEVEARLNGPTDREANEVSVRLNQKLPALFLTYGGEGEGSVRSGASAASPGITLDTTQWHTYTLAVSPAADSFVTTLYVDGTAIAWYEEGVGSYSGGTLIRIGADNGGTCDMDIRAVRMSSQIAQPIKLGTISNVEIDAAGGKEGEAKNLAVTADFSDFADGTQADVELVRAASGKAVPGVATTAQVAEGKIAAQLEIPASLSVGVYRVRVSVGIVSALSGEYTVELNRARPVLPSFEAVGYTIEMDDYIYNPTIEFNFPSIVDTSVHGLPDGSEPIARYYLYYSPHNSPGGICLMTANSLEGPWTEYAKNPLVSEKWEGHYSVSHVSSGDVVWNEEAGLYFMYFHGENNVTRYATSENLVDWTYGAAVVYANDFSPTGSGYTEASYGRVFEYEVPGLGNKYIMTIMVNNTANMRKIFWAHSEDGRTWTAVTTPLLSPDTYPEHDYAGNLSGAYFFTHEGRCFVIAHGSTGDMYLFEVGQELSEEIHWGLFYDSGDGAPDYARSGAPCFIQDDDGVWHMFYEGGVRLHANIVHARQVSEAELGRLSRAELSLSSAALYVGETATATVSAYRKDGGLIEEGLSISYHAEPADYATFEGNVLTALKAGSFEVYAQVSLGDDTVKTAPVAVSVRLVGPGLQFATGTPIVDNSTVTASVKSNLELPWVIKVGDKYHLYFDYSNASGANGGIALATAPSLNGPWEIYNGGTPLIASSAGSPAVIYREDLGEYWMYYNSTNAALQLATSTDGISWTHKQQVLSAAALGEQMTKDNCYQVSVYEHELEGKGNRFVMLITVNPTGAKALAMAWSADGITWETNGRVLLEPDSSDSGNIASPRLLRYEGESYLTFHNSSGNVEYALLDAGFETAIRIGGTLYDSAEGEPDNGRAADAFFLQEGGVLHMFYAARSNKGVGAASSLIAHSSIVLVDFGALQALAQQASALDAQLYTTASWEKLAAALAAAQQVLANEAATQKQVDDALEALLGAMDGLVEKTPAGSPATTAKEEEKYTRAAEGGYSMISFKLYDEDKIAGFQLNSADYVALTPNNYSDINYIKVGGNIKGAKLGLNELKVFDAAGNVSVYEFTLVLP